MFKLFTYIKERPSDQLITKEEIEIASGRKVLDPGQATLYLKDIENASENLRQAFEKQEKQAAVCYEYFDLRCYLRTKFINLGSMGSRQVRATSCRMDGCM